MQQTIPKNRIYKEAAIESIKKLNPILLKNNIVILIVEISAIWASILSVMNFMGAHNKDLPTYIQISIWLWFTVIFANFAESVAEGNGKARATSFRKTKNETTVKKLSSKDPNSSFEIVPSNALQPGDYVLLSEGDIVPTDGEIVHGIATVNESTITGESAPVIRESGGDRSGLTGGTQVISDTVIMEVTAKAGESFLDHMIKLVESAKRQPTPNEVALNIVLVAITIIFTFVIVSLMIFANYIKINVPIIYLIALFITLIPTTIGGLLSAIGISGMDRLLKFNIIAKSGRAVEAAGDVNILLLDKTGTITYGNRMATEFMPVTGVKLEELAYAAYVSSLSDTTAEGKSILKLADDKFSCASKTSNLKIDEHIEFSAKTRMSGVKSNQGEFLKGATASMLELGEEKLSPAIKKEMKAHIEYIAKKGGTPLVVSHNKILLGVIYLKDIIKPGLRERFIELRKMGIKTVMITGDNPLTAATIAAEAGVDDFLAEATPEKKLELIRNEQKQGKLVAMCGDGSNDAPALAQADVGIAMNIGTQAAKDAGNMVDLDSNPTKLIEVVMIGKQLLMTRGSLTTFSLANDFAKYFAIIPALFASAHPKLGLLNIMRLTSPESAILSAIIFNALIVIALIPLALKGTKYSPAPAKKLLSKNLLIYGLGGIVAPFIGIKIIEEVILSIGLI